MKLALANEQPPKQELKDPLLVGVAQIVLDFYLELQKRKYRKKQKNERKSFFKTV
jgi:hypothetical protein